MYKGEKVPRQFWRTDIKQRFRNKRSNSENCKDQCNYAVLERLVNKLFPIENIYQDTNQTGTAREQKLRREAVIIGELKRKHEC